MKIPGGCISPEISPQEPLLHRSAFLHLHRLGKEMKRKVRRLEPYKSPVHLRRDAVVVRRVPVVQARRQRRRGFAKIVAAETHVVQIMKQPPRLDVHHEEIVIGIIYVGKKVLPVQMIGLHQEAVRQGVPLEEERSCRRRMEIFILAGAAAAGDLHPAVAGLEFGFKGRLSAFREGGVGRLLRRTGRGPERGGDQKQQCLFHLTPPFLIV